MGTDREEGAALPSGTAKAELLTPLLILHARKLAIGALARGHKASLTSQQEGRLLRNGHRQRGGRHHPSPRRAPPALRASSFFRFCCDFRCGPLTGAKASAVVISASSESEESAA